MGQYVKAGAALFSIGSSLLGGKAEKRAGDAAAAAELATSAEEAAKIRKLVRQVRGQATAAYAASGVDVSEGTPLVVERDIIQGGEEDALNTLLSGRRRAGALKEGGSVGQRAGYLDAAGSALSWYGQFGGNWKRSSPSPRKGP